MRDRKGERLALEHEWVIGERVGGGGFGEVFEVSGEAGRAVAKFVPKDPGADRELLFVDLEWASNVVPVLEFGEHDECWVLIMPRADRSLRNYLDDVGDVLEVDEALRILRDVCDTLIDLDGEVVHRDLKPENILLLDGTWCLADFGISRYAEATTAPDTQKFALSPQYAAPERWRSERATTAVDVYSLGVIAHEMLTGRRPFPGPSTAEFREQHLHSTPPTLERVPPAVAALVQECLYKAVEARPRPLNVRARLDAIRPAKSPGLAKLQEANHAEVQRKSQADRRASEELSEQERRGRLHKAAAHSFAQISTELLDTITGVMPSAQVEGERRGGWGLRINNAEFQFSTMTTYQMNRWGGWDPPAFEVLCSASLTLRVPADRFGYDGRSHSLWYGDIQEEGQFGWFETAFMISPLSRRRRSQVPFSLDPGEEAAKAVWSGTAEYQMAWPFNPLVLGELDDFIDRWAGWLADAAQGRLSEPRTMPERGAKGSWRKS